MRVEDTAIAGVKLVHLDVFRDERGHFVETFDARSYAALGLHQRFVQDSFSYSAKAGVVRGMHLQIAPAAQAKLIRVVRGKVFDAVVDLRRDGGSFGKSLSFLLNDQDMCCLLLPPGVAHGFCTLVEHTELSYKMSDHFSPAHYRGVLWSDPALHIDWPVSATDAIVSERDQQHPHLADYTGE